MRNEKGVFVPGELDPDQGRKPGSTNKLTRTVKETVLAVFNKLQEDPKHNLKKFAETYPRDFYAIAAKLIPTEINAKINKVKLEIVRTNTTEAESTPPEPAEGTE